MQTTGKIFITGSTGFIGTKLIEKLLERGFSVRALARKPPEQPKTRFPACYLEYVQGDITDIESLRRGMDGCQYVFHLAAYAKNWAKNKSTYEKVNIEGTQKVFQVAQELNVERIVYTSTIVTLGYTPKGVIGDETMPRVPKCFTQYEETKTRMEQEALQWVHRGLPLVIVNPTRVYGPGLFSESNTVSILINDYRKGRFPFLLNRGVNIGNYGFVDDVAEGHILAMQKGRIGERYILGGGNCSLEELFKTVDKVDGKKRFQLKIYWVIPMLVANFLQRMAEWFGAYPPLTPDWVRTFLVDWAFTCKKAQQELGYTITPLEEGIRRTCQWLDEQTPRT
ncbi:MAG: NAD-dependent epimerase/dehydratase family protein [Planctomycetaceae bacterium]|jgi:farnesol dehydrogenase|nr:NAD-dependent epimerase/dehydratase family protein [Planctomycetaceae bacterium]